MDTLAACLERFRVYADAGVTELGIWLVGNHAVEDVARLGEALPSMATPSAQ